MPPKRSKRSADKQPQPDAKRVRTDARLQARQRLSDFSRLQPEDVRKICADISAYQYEYLEASSIFQNFHPQYSSLQARYFEINKNEMAKCAQWMERNGTSDRKNALKLSRHMLGCLIRTMGDIREAAVKVNHHATALEACTLEACALAKTFSSTDSGPDSLDDVPDAVERFDAALNYLATHKRPRYTSVSMQTDVQEPLLLGPAPALAQTSTVLTTDHSPDSHLSALVKSFEVVQNSRTPSWDHVHGLDSLKSRLATAVFASRNAHIFQHLPRRRMISILLYGPEGTGKTSFVKSFAKSHGLPMFSVCGAIKGSLPGQTEKAFTLLAKEIVARQSCVLFFDNADGLLRSPDFDNGCSFRPLTTIKLLWDEIKGSRRDVFVFGATNKPWDIMKAGFRPLFRHLVLVGMPDHPTRCLLFQSLLPSASSINANQITGLATMSDGYSGSDIKAAISRLGRELVLECRQAQAWRNIRSGDEVWLSPASKLASEQPVLFDSLSADEKLRVRPRPMTYTELRGYFEPQSSKVLRKTVRNEDMQAYIEWQEQEGSS